MDPTSLSPLLPLGGGFFLLVYLIGTLINDRVVLRRQARTSEASWAKERDDMRLQCRRDIADATSDLRQRVEFQRDRITELEHENARLRKRDAS